MAFNMREELIKASRIHFKAHIEKHRINIENLLENSDLGRTRTSNRQSRNLVFYPVELLGLFRKFTKEFTSAIFDYI